MDFQTSVANLAMRVKDLRDLIETEEATKNAFIQPFLQLLGYDPSDPRVVVPEYTADTGTKKNEKVDYVVMKEGKPIMLFECKSCGTSLDQGKANQLHRYFQNTPTARVGVLTDGVIYEFYSDLDKPNLMDPKPFMIFDFENIDETLIVELQKLGQGNFNEDTTLNAAQNLKYTRQIKRFLSQELDSPSDDFVRQFASKIYSGPLRANVIEEFRSRVAQAARDYINDKIDERLKKAMTGGKDSAVLGSTETGDVENNSEKENSKITTTEEEFEGFHIVKSILREDIDLSRIVMRDKQSYCGILLDDNNRKPICRLHFNATQKYLGVFDENKTEERKPIETLDDIYSFANQLKATIAQYDD
ncbi:MAG: type I restriction enzyme HsdR N-terminal domain-containing protein [Pseudodesulfovibrio sp.]|nr:type I restriction enzyme HsdR N-terminal domain-containing protein [Pseudodesulfovibrio sp.]